MTASSEGGKFTWDELPAAITTFLPAHEARDTKTAIDAFALDALVTDEGRTYHGRDKIRGWLERSSSEYTYTTEFVSATHGGEAGWDIVQHLEGDFPGRMVDLHYRFTLDGERITRLVIEP
ncbi:nuclear transport factor 2 family protein [Verrucosispora sp. WMMD573]|uniref:nuclear transport factor 2 family protein n=1 Tax=Verrucosispora sp. WMMD573 TaxID=3015149 RepID=UPI00248B7CAD|nr:nuclear transport factor 2 family protein [Verrucosispora sp. WMMD573]WBB53795.1 nuclear transport factor 2 family protein [Verrucosispora sp. WMMD573]